MTLNQAERQDLIKDNRVHDNDTGSPEVQIAILTEEIKRLTGHMKLHPKDYHSRRGLLMKVNCRSKLLRYLNKSAHPRYLDITNKLGLRR